MFSTISFIFELYFLNFSRVKRWSHYLMISLLTILNILLAKAIPGILYHKTTYQSRKYIRYEGTRQGPCFPLHLLLFFVSYNIKFNFILIISRLNFVFIIKLKWYCGFFLKLPVNLLKLPVNLLKLPVNFLKLPVNFLKLPG